MMRRVKVFSIILFAILLNSCFHNKNDNKVVAVEKYKNGKIKTEVWSFDSIIIKKIYNEYGSLIDSIPLKNDTIHGVRKSYIDGYLTYTNYVDGEREGSVNAIYLNGNIRYKGQCENDKQVGEWVFFYTNNKLATYEYHFKNGEIAYLRKYDEEGDLISSMGEGIGNISYKSLKINKGEKFTSKISVATPPQCKVEAVVSELDNDSIEIRSFDYELKNGCFYYSEKFDTVGVYKRGIYWLLNDTVNLKKENDSYVLTIIVE